MLTAGHERTVPRVCPGVFVVVILQPDFDGEYYDRAQAGI